jgi:hypothetical protein
MWSNTQITIEIEDCEHPVILVKIVTPAGTVDLVGEVAIDGRIMKIDGAHVGGLSPGKLGRAGLNAVGRKLLEVADVDEILIQGGARSTGRRPGTVPRIIRFPRS